MNTRQILLATGAIALNLTLAKIAALLSLPVYLDSTGTILSVALVPWYLSFAIALGTSLLGAVIIDPGMAVYCGTQLTISCVAILCFRANLFSSWQRSILAGLIIAISAVLVSVPITVLVFGGITWSETTALTSVLLSSGKNIWQSVLQGSIFIESIDKISASLLAWLVLKFLPVEFTVKAPTQEHS